MRRREEPMEEQNKLNEEKDRNIQSQEADMVTGRMNVDDGSIRKVRTQGESATKPKPTEEKRYSKKGTKNNN